MKQNLLFQEPTSRPFFYALFFLILGFIYWVFGINEDFFIQKPKYKEINNQQTSQYHWEKTFPRKYPRYKISSVSFDKILKIRCCPQRPDLGKKDRLFVVLPQLEEEVLSNEWFYLQKTDQVWGFSKTEGPISFRILEKNRSFYIEEKISYAFLGFSELKDQKKIYPAVIAKDSQQLSIPTLFNDLCNSIYYGRDYLREPVNYRLDLPKQSLLVEKNASFVYNVEKWERFSDQTTNLRPLFRVKSVSNEQIVLECWTTEGRYFSKTFSQQRPKEPRAKKNNWISQVKKRTNTKVSLNLMGKRTLLKKGDWLVEKQEKWQVLRTLGQKQAFLDQGTSSEVFVFENIDENKSEKKLCGVLYNATRNKYKKMEIPFGAKKQSSATGKEIRSSSSSDYVPVSRR